MPLIYGDFNDSVTSSVQYGVNFDLQFRILFGVVKLSSGYDGTIFSWTTINCEYSPDTHLELGPLVFSYGDWRTQGTPQRFINIAKGEELMKRPLSQVCVWLTVAGGDRCFSSVV